MRQPSRPYCGVETRLRGGELSCLSGSFRFPPKLARWLKEALSKVEPSARIEQEVASHGCFSCPNCGTEFQQCSANMHFLKCAHCGLELPATIHMALSELREYHHADLRLGRKKTPTKAGVLSQAKSL